MAGVRRIWSMGLAGAISGALAVAQSNHGSGSLAGKLTDSYSTPLIGATVTLHNEATGAEARTTTTKNGAYRFTGLDAGEYTLEAESPQLGRGRVDGIVVSAGHEARVQAAIELERPLHRAVQVALHEIDPAAQVVNTTIEAEQLQQLPLTGRHWEDFAPETPATALPADGSQTSFRGSGQAEPETTIDGATRTLAFGSTGAGRATDSESRENGIGAAWTRWRAPGANGPPMSQTAIRQVQIADGNAEAAADRAAAGALDFESRSGENALHGQVFFFDRQNSWGARNPLTQWVRQTSPATALTTPVFSSIPYTPADRELTFGAGVGGRIRRDRLFWFGAVDGFRRNDPGLSTVKHPEQFFAQPGNDEMQVLAARLGLSGVNPVVEGLAAYSQMLSTLDGLLGPAPRTAAQEVGFARVDWNAAERHHFSFEGIGALWDSPGGGLTRVEQTYGNRSYGTSHATERWALARWEAFLTPNLLATTKGSWGRDVLSTRAETPSPFEQGFLNGNAWGQLPQMVVDSRYGFTIGNPARFGAGSYPDERVAQAQEAVDWVHGGLLVKAGFDLIHNSDGTSLLRNQTGTYHYSTVENFVSDALTFAAFGLKGALDPVNQHNCDQTGKVWRDSAGNLRGLGDLPCYSYFSQALGPNAWKLSTNDWAGFVTAQWHPAKLLVFSTGVRWEREQLPPTIPGIANPSLPLTMRMPSLGNNWGPRASLALGVAESHWPVLRFGYGMYFARTENGTVETALSQTGSPKSDLNFFFRPTDDQPGYSGGAPPFPYVLQGEPLNEVKPGAVELAPRFKSPEVHQAVAGVEETLPGGVRVTASALASLGRRLPSSIDANIDPAVNPGTITAANPGITYYVCDETTPGLDNGRCGNLGIGPIPTGAPVKFPFYALWPSVDCPAGAKLNSSGQCGRLDPNYQQVDEIMSRANSTYEAAVLKVERYGRHGLSLHAHYTYAHAMDWNPIGSPNTSGSGVFDPADLALEYGTSDLDVRHSAAVMAVLEPPWKIRGGARNWAAQAGNGWMLSGIGHYGSGLPYTMRTSGSIPEEFDSAGHLIVGLGPGMNGSGGDSRVYGVGRNTFRYPATWKADLRLGKSFDLGQLRRLELLAESFNLFNHQNVTELESTGYDIESGSSPSALYGSAPPPTLNFLTSGRFSTKTGLPLPAFGVPLNINGTNFYRERQIQFGVRMRF